jgi:hypothetical protein
MLCRSSEKREGVLVTKRQPFKNANMAIVGKKARVLGGFMGPITTEMFHLFPESACFFQRLWTENATGSD